MDKVYRMKEVSELLGITRRHLQRLDKAGKIKCIRTPGGQRRVAESEIKRLRGESSRGWGWVIYTRVSSHEQKQKGDLARQVEYLRKVIPEGNGEVRIISDVGSGLSDRRKGFLSLIMLAKEGKISDIAVTDKDRLCRFGFDYLKEFFKAFGVEIHTLDIIGNKAAKFCNGQRGVKYLISHRVHRGHRERKDKI